MSDIVEKAYIAHAQTSGTPPEIVWKFASICEFPELAQDSVRRGAIDLMRRDIWHESEDAFDNYCKEWKEAFAQKYLCCNIPWSALFIDAEKGASSLAAFEFNMRLVRVLSNSVQTILAQHLIEIDSASARGDDESIYDARIWRALMMRDYNVAQLIRERSSKFANLARVRDFVSYFGRLDLYKIIEGDARVFVCLGDMRSAVLGGDLQMCEYIRRNGNFNIQLASYIECAVIGGHVRICDFLREWFCHLCDDSVGVRRVDMRAAKIDSARNFIGEWKKQPLFLAHIATMCNDRAMLKYLIKWQLEICANDREMREFIEEIAKTAQKCEAYRIVHLVECADKSTRESGESICDVFRAICD